MASTRGREADLFSSSPAHPSHHRTQIPPNAPVAKKLDFGVGGGTKRANLKRTASTASLLTPPGSPEKEKLRSPKRSFSDSEDEDDEDEEMDSPGTRPMRKRKSGVVKNSRLAMKEHRAQGRLGRQDTIVLQGKKLVSPRRAAIGEEVDRMHLDSDDGEQASPGRPPRTPKRKAALPLKAEPTTPTRKPNAKRAMPERDSPNNPFLRSSPRLAKPKVDSEEKPTITYVFRGQKAVFRNPAYTGPEGPGPNTRFRASLRPEHPEFSPDLITAPKLLFPSAVDSDDEEKKPRSRSKQGNGQLPTPEASGSRGARAAKRRKVAEENDGDLFGKLKKAKMVV